MAADGPLSRDEYAHWLCRLGRTPQAKIGALRTLLEYAREDDMSPTDRAICVRALRELTRG